MTKRPYERPHTTVRETLFSKFLEILFQLISIKAPIFNNIEVELHDVQLNGTLWPPKYPSFSPLEPGPSTDAIWESFEPLNVFPISRADIIGLGKDPNTAVHFPNDIFGLGEDAYMAGYDSLHKTHCLNELRKMTFEDYGEHAPVVKKKHGKLWWLHLRHCVDMLMQDQLCHADADVITFTWVDTQSHPWADMSINRKCRNWEQLMRWGQDRYIDIEKVKAYIKPEGVVVLPYERGYYLQYGFDDSEMFPNGTGYVW
ncbi:MAG: hypothetical protein Q9216_002633 [Gyalolechia sp. 2 TL-2023]